MALVRKPDCLTIDQNKPRDEVECTYSIILGDDGEELLQIDTYGSRLRQMPGKKSQSIRFSRRFNSALAVVAMILLSSECLSQARNTRPPSSLEKMSQQLSTIGAIDDVAISPDGKRVAWVSSGKASQP